MENSRHAFFIIASYGAFAFALAVEVALLVRRRAAARRRLGTPDHDDDL